jgi:hypothetical protein
MVSTGLACARPWLPTPAGMEMCPVSEMGT